MSHSSKRETLRLLGFKSRWADRKNTDVLECYYLDTETGEDLKILGGPSSIIRSFDYKSVKTCERETIAPLPPRPPGSAGHAGGIILPAQWLWRMGDGYLTLIMSALVPPVCTSLEMQMLANVNKTPPNFKDFLYSSPYHNIHNEATVLWINVSSIGLWMDRVIRINGAICNFFTFVIFSHFHIFNFSHL